MQSILYLNNFRDFNNTYLPLADVNFFVGENSTGKTSVLRLIKVLCQADFWLRPGFEEMDTEFGDISEITSQNSFEVAHTIVREDKVVRFVKLTFAQQGNTIELSEFSELDNSHSIKAKIKPNTIKYSVKLDDNTSIFDGDILNKFKNWVENESVNMLNYPQKIVDRVSFMPLIWQMKLVIDSMIRESNEVSKTVPYYPILPNFSWLAPIRTEPKRTYDSLTSTYSPDGKHTPYLIKSMLDKKYSNSHRRKFEEILTKFGKDSGLFDGITINKLGKSKRAPFEIYIDINNRSLKITNVGYGVSQILPLIVEIVYEENYASFALQQPEIHLHPRGQAAFGDLIFKSASLENKKFIIETHSDYTIDRFRWKLKKSETENIYRPKSQVVFFHRTKNGNNLSVISILPNGTYSDNQPPEFKNFFINEQLSLLDI